MMGIIWELVNFLQRPSTPELKSDTKKTDEHYLVVEERSIDNLNFILKSSINLSIEQINTIFKTVYIGIVFKKDFSTIAVDVMKSISIFTCIYITQHENTIEIVL